MRIWIENGLKVKLSLRPVNPKLLSLGFWWWSGCSSLIVPTISALSTSLFGSPGGYVAPVHFILCCYVETQNQCAGLAANRCCFTDQPLVKQSSRRQKKHNDGRPENPRERKNKGQRARTRIHTYSTCVKAKMYTHTQIAHALTRGGEAQSVHVEASKKTQQNEPQKGMQTLSTHSLLKCVRVSGPTSLCEWM